MDFCRQDSQDGGRQNDKVDDEGVKICPFVVKTVHLFQSQARELRQCLVIRVQMSQKL